MRAASPPNAISSQRKFSSAAPTCSPIPTHRPRHPLEVLKGTQHDPGQHLGWTDSRTGEPTTILPTIAAAATSLLDLDWKTASGILATALSHLGLYRDPVVTAKTETSDFTAEELVAPAERRSVSS